MQATEISWTELTWGVVSGCTQVSPECRFCYAETLAENKRGTKAFPNGFDITMRPWKLDEPARIRKPSLIFCNSTSDYAHKDIPDSYRAQIFDAIEATPRHRYQILTKRPAELLAWFKRSGRRMPPSVWMGVTIGHNHHSSTDRLKYLHGFRDVGAKILFISAEPLLTDLPISLTGVDWIITGGESGYHASDPKILRDRFLVERDKAGRWALREDRAPWLRQLRDEAERAGCAHWHKQHGGPRPTSGGRVLDGRTHDGMPTHIPDAMPAGYVHAVPVHKADQFHLPMVGS